MKYSRADLNTPSGDLLRLEFSTLKGSWGGESDVSLSLETSHVIHPLSTENNKNKKLNVPLCISNKS